MRSCQLPLNPKETTMKKAIVTVEIESSLNLIDLLTLVKKAILNAKLEKEGFIKVVQIQGNRIK